MKCSMPYTNLEIRNDGSFGPCCINQYSYVKDNGEKFNIARDSLEDVWNSTDRIRYATQLDNENLAECHQCWYAESSNGISKRIMENDQRFGKIKETPFSLDVKFTNACNLKCVICSPMNSSQWYSDFEFLYPGAFDNSAYKWISQIDIFEKLKNYLHTAEILEFYGGEPLSLKYYNNILKYCVDSNISKTQKIRTNTNGTIRVTDELLEYYSNFDYVGLQWSIDSLIQKEFEYQRFPAKFDVVMDNIENVLAKAPPSVNIGITYTVSALNIFSIHSMVDFVKKHNIWLHLNVLSGPDFLRFNTLPKKLINDYLNSIDVTDVKFTTLTVDNLKNYDSVENCAKMNNQLKTYLTKLDSRRNTCYKDTFDVLGSILNDI